MANMFANTKISSDDLRTNASQASKFAIPATNAYRATCKVAYVTPNPFRSADLDLTFILELENGFEWKLALTVMSNNSAMATRNGKEELLYGHKKALNVVTAILGAEAVEKGLESLGDSVSKTIDIYNFKEGKAVPTPVDTFPIVANKDLFVCLVRKVANKMVRNEDGSFTNLPEKKITAVLNNTANEAGFSVNEILDGAEEPEEVKAWLESNKGKDWDAYKPVKGAATSVAGAKSKAKPTYTFD